MSSLSAAPDPLATTAIATADDHDPVAAARLFKALGDPIRVKLLTLVRRSPEGEACFCDLADEFDFAQSTLSHHLKILVEAGVLSRERRGTWSWYRVEHDAMNSMEDILRPGGPLRAEPRHTTDCDC
ncbi:ArsR/SmtB family transcription factor [Nocardia barduliensis]|uniref:ArsR/SmtB family transcription factor n=1 Tax=Nocardia barduliensis TaxID=2736643 RepID=UPI001571D869|nr:metalloregulator ArsR/SmtB family transcription factor [Nocardia barduliensis]